MWNLQNAIYPAFFFLFLSKRRRNANILIREIAGVRLGVVFRGPLQRQRNVVENKSRFVRIYTICPSTDAFSGLKSAPSCNLTRVVSCVARFLSDRYWRNRSPRGFGIGQLMLLYNSHIFQTIQIKVVNLIVQNLCRMKYKVLPTLPYESRLPQSFGFQKPRSPHCRSPTSSAPYFTI